MRRYILLVAARAFICAFAYPSDTTQSGRQAGKPSKRASGSVRASRRAHCTHFSSIRTCSKPLRNIYVLATCRVIGWQHVAYCPAAYSVLPCPGIMLCVDLTEQHSQCCQGLATYSVLLRCITLATFVAQPLHLENFYDPVLRLGRQLLNTQLQCVCELTKVSVVV